jgi:hypothetical protein
MVLWADAKGMQENRARRGRSNLGRLTPLSTHSLHARGPRSPGGQQHTVDHQTKVGVCLMTRMSRTLLPLSFVLALALFATPALATETGTTGYYNTPPKPATTPAPASGTGPSRETSKPRTTSSSPSNTSTSPTGSTPTPTVPAPSTSTRSTLPFTGLDLRWVVGIGLLLLGAGLSIRVTQRRQRQDLGR